MSIDGQSFSTLAQVQEVDWGKLILILVFFVGLPALGRFLRWIAQRSGALDADEQRGVERTRRREERRTAERQGGEVWRRLLEGLETPAAPPPRPAPPRPRPSTRVTPPPVLEGPTPLSVLGEAPGPKETALAEESLESGESPAPLDALGSPIVSTAAVAARSGWAFTLSGGELRRAVLLAEVLGPPVSNRTAR